MAFHSFVPFGNAIFLAMLKCRLYCDSETLGEELDARPLTSLSCSQLRRYVAPVDCASVLVRYRYGEFALALALALASKAPELPTVCYTELDSARRCFYA